MFDPDITRIYTTLDKVSEEQKSLLASISILKEQVRKIEINDELQITEIGNLKLSIGKYSATIQFITEQINELVSQRTELLSSAEAAKDSARQATAFEAICNEKFKNISDTINHVQQQDTLVNSNLELKMDVLKKHVEKLEVKYNYVAGVVLSGMTGFIIWAIKMFGSAHGWC